MVSSLYQGLNYHSMIILQDKTKKKAMPAVAASFFRMGRACVGGRLLSRFLRVGMDLLFPPRCLICDCFLPSGSLPYFCPACLDSLPLVSAPFCSQCGLPLRVGDAATRCGSCLVTRDGVDKMRFLFRYDETVARLVHGLKFRAHFAMLSSLGQLVQTSGILRDLAPFDYIMPVPLSSWRLRRRGYNQSLLLARAFLPEDTHKIRLNLLKRPQGGHPQRGLSGSERRYNVRGCFHVNQSCEILGKSVLLVDDVLTTGATIQECATILRSNGASPVQALVLARVC